MLERLRQRGYDGTIQAVFAARSLAAMADTLTPIAASQWVVPRT